MKNNRDLPREKAPYEPPTIQVLRLLTEETVLSVCKTFTGAGGISEQCVQYPCLSQFGLT